MSATDCQDCSGLVEEIHELESDARRPRISLADERAISAAAIRERDEARALSVELVSQRDELVEALESLYSFPGVTDLLAPKGSLMSIRDAVESSLARARRCAMSAPILSPNGVAIWVDVPRECRCKRMANLFVNKGGVTGCSQCIEEEAK